MVLTEEEFLRLGIDNTTDIELERLHKSDGLIEAYRNIIDILRKYCDLKEEYYSLISVWIIGTYYHKEFITYPYLFINAMKGSGKTRLLKIIAELSYKGEILTSMTEAVLFRTEGTLCIDEFEGITRHGNENLRELLNSSYKQGSKVKRMRKARTPEGEQQVVEEFNVYRPIAMANIWGMETVLGDRCLALILERSNVVSITKLVETFPYEKITTLTKELLSKGECSLCNVVTPREVYTGWNDFIDTNYITTFTNNNTKLHTLFTKIDKADINGRDLELSLPLFLIAEELGEGVLDDLILTIQKIVNEKKTEEFTENKDISLIDFVSQELNEDLFVSVNSLVPKFKDFLQVNDDWINSKWVGRALKRLNLIKKKKRVTRGVEVVLDVEKAQEKIRMFR